MQQFKQNLYAVDSIKQHANKSAEKNSILPQFQTEKRNSAMAVRDRRHAGSQMWVAEGS
jgi:hypothetical protein